MIIPSGWMLALAVVVAFAVGSNDGVESCNCWPKIPGAPDASSCGSDGRTYDNYCRAGCANVTVAYDGKCKARASTTLKTCSRCPKDYNPVCGIDGTTYSTECFAKCAGAAVAFSGPCFNATVKCLGSCGAGNSTPVCDASKGITYISKCVSKCAGVKVTQTGRCVPKKSNASESCYCTVKGNVREDVCSSERMTYSNRCFAKCAGVKVVYDGECQNVPRPSAAENNWMRWANYKVCGTDGKPYQNLCHAKCAGVQVESMIGGVC